VYAYPVVESPEARVTTARNLEVVPEARHLYAHLLENRRIEDLTGYQEEHLRVFARDVLGSIRSGDRRWEPLVPLPVVRLIQERRLFGYPGLVPSAASHSVDPVE
jgi:hypothetical protein